MGSSKSAYPAGWHDRPGPVLGSSLTADGTNPLMSGNAPEPSGLAVGAIQGTLADGHSLLHLEILQAAAQHPGERVDSFTVAETFRYYILDRNIDGSVRKSSKNKEYIHKYKSYYVHAMRDPIKAAAARFDLPAVLLAGTVYNEVGGADMVKPYVYVLRDLFAGSEAADRTSLGPTSLQPRRALAALGYNPANVDISIKKDVVQSLIHNDAFAIFVCAKHLSDLRDLFFPKKDSGDLVDDDLVVLGARYDFGPDQSEETVRNDLSYGRHIVGRKELLAKLLTDAPVKEPDWSEPLKNAVKSLGKIPE
jgi:hypothetical protein